MCALGCTSHNSLHLTWSFQKATQVLEYHLACKNRLSPELPHAESLTLPTYHTDASKSNHFFSMVEQICVCWDGFCTVFAKSSWGILWGMVCTVLCATMLFTMCTVQCAVYSIAVLCAVCSTAVLFTRCGRHFHSESLLAFSPHQRWKPSSWSSLELSWMSIMMIVMIMMMMIMVWSWSMASLIFIHQTLP